MAKMIELDLHPDRRTLRQFGLMALLVFGALAACALGEAWLFAGGLGAARLPVAWALAGVAVVSGLFSAVFPAGNRALYVGMSVVAFPIGLVTSYVVLGVLFFGVITPIGLVLRLTGKDPMMRRFRSDQASYWSEARSKRDKASYFRQF